MSGTFASLLRQIDICMDKVNAMIATPAMDEGAGVERADGLDIELRDVSFGYENRTVIDRVSLAIPARTTCAIVGPSGSGKTTIANNIKFGRPDATHEEVVEAARRACCHEFVEGLPEGYATRLGEGGATLSGGERQRLSIARAILKDAPIVILDEATANVDPENERDLQRAIAELTRSKTVIMIAHRLKTVRDADQIVVLDGGRIVQRGTHDALMAEGGLYADFVGMRERAIGWKLGGAATCANAPA